MAIKTFQVVVEGTDRLYSVRFLPEGKDNFPINWHRQSGFMKYSSPEFDVDVAGRFDFRLIVEADQSVKYNYLVKMKSGDAWLEIAKDKRKLTSGTDEVTMSVDIANPPPTPPALA